MYINIRIFVFIAAFIIFYSVFLSLKRHKLSESTSVLWLFIAFLSLLVGIFPQIIDWFAALIGISYQPMFAVLVVLVVILLMLFRMEKQSSVQEARIRELTIQLSLVKSQLHEEMEAAEQEKGAHTKEENKGRKNI